MIHLLSFQRCVQPHNLRSTIKSHFLPSSRADRKMPRLKDMPRLAMDNADDNGTEMDISLEHVSLKLWFSNKTYRSGAAVGEGCHTVEGWIDRRGAGAFDSSQVRYLGGRAVRDAMSVQVASLVMLRKMFGHVVPHSRHHFLVVDRRCGKAPGHSSPTSGRPRHHFCCASGISGCHSRGRPSAGSYCR